MKKLFKFIILPLLLSTSLISLLHAQSTIYATDLNANAAGWTYSTTYGGAFKWVNNVGVTASGGLVCNEPFATTTPTVPFTISTPILTLQAGNSYRIAFDAYGIINSKRALRFHLNGTPNLAGSPVNVGQSPQLTTAWTNYTLDFTVPTTGNFYLVVNMEKQGTNHYGKAYMDNFSISPTNTPPTVSILNPANSANLFRGNQSVTVNAADPGGSVSKVELFANNIKVAESTISPFTLTWNTAILGATSLYTKATDNIGATTNSTTINVRLYS